MIVDDGDTSQWNRSAIEPRDRSCRPIPVGNPHDRLEVLADAPGRSPAPSRRARPRRAAPGAEEAPRPRHRARTRVERLATLDARDDAHDRVLERRVRQAARARSASETNARGASRRRRGSRRTPGDGRPGRAARPRAAASRRGPPRSAVPAAARSRRAAPAGCRRSIDDANGSSTWSRTASNGRRECSTGSRQVWWTYSAAPWSMSWSRRCHTRRLDCARSDRRSS